jgi:uncharacterized protein YidB (DUF937 family)
LNENCTLRSISWKVGFIASRPKERLRALEPAIGQGGTMGLLEELVGKATGTPSSGSAEQTSGLATGIMQMLSSQPGGLPGLVQAFHEKGLGSIVNSWVGTGQNLPISAEQIQGVLGSEQVKQLAAKVGISPDVAGSKLAEILPVVVDKLTPDGKIPEGGGLFEQALGFFNRKS